MSKVRSGPPRPLRGGFARIVIPTRTVDQERADHGDRFMPTSDSARMSRRGGRVRRNRRLHLRSTRSRHRAGDRDRPVKWPAAERAFLDIRGDSGARPERPRYTATAYSSRREEIGRRLPIRLEGGSDKGVDGAYAPPSPKRHTGMPSLRALSARFSEMPEPGKTTRPVGSASSIVSLRLKGAALRWRFQSGLNTTWATLRLSAQHAAIRSAPRGLPPCSSTMSACLA